MTKAFTITSKNRIISGPSGMGAKVVTGYMLMEPASEAVHPSDVELNTIKALLVEQNFPGTYVVVDLYAPGTVHRWEEGVGTYHPNFASLVAYNLVTDAGTAPVKRAAGSVGLRFAAFGE